MHIQDHLACLQVLREQKHSETSLPEESTTLAESASNNPLRARQRAEVLARCLRPGVEWDVRAAALQELVELVQGGELSANQLLDLLKQLKEPLKHQILDR